MRAKLHLFVAAMAVLFFGLGTAIPVLVHTPAGFGLRMAGLLLFALYAWQRRSLTVWIFFAMLAGVETGLDLPRVALSCRVLSDVFLRLIKTIVAPLLLGTLITGIAAHGGARAVGRLGIKALIYFEILTTLALVVGLAAINISRAGVGVSITAVEATASSAAPAQPAQALVWDQFLLHAVPENLARAVAENQILQVAVFAVLFGLALGQLAPEKSAPLLRLLESLTETMFEFTNLVMYLAPIGVAAALAYTVAHAGLGVMVNLARLLLTLYAALGAFILVGLIPAALIARIPLRRFASAVAEPATIAFATSTSEAALPRAMECMESFGVPRRIVGFVLPAGYSFNLDGSTLYLALASVFVAQAAGVPMTLGQQAMMLLTLMLTSKGVAGVPRATLVVLLATAATFHLPTEPIFLLLGIDPLMDMARTAINVVGNCLASAVVARWEGELNLPETAS